MRDAGMLVAVSRSGINGFSTKPGGFIHRECLEAQLRPLIDSALDDTEVEVPWVELPAFVREIKTEAALAGRRVHVPPDAPDWLRALAVWR